MGMLDMLGRGVGMLTEPKTLQALQYLQSRHHGMMPDEINTLRSQQSYYESMNAQRQAEEEERQKRLEQEQRQAAMRESQTAAAGILAGMSEPEKQAYLRGPQNMAWWAGPDADKGISQAALGAITPPEGGGYTIKTLADGRVVYLPKDPTSGEGVVDSGVRGPVDTPQRPTAKDQYGIERYTDNGQAVFSQDALGVPETERFTREGALRKDFETAVKPYVEQGRAAGRLIPILEGGGGGVNDLALITQFMKLLDPTSTVREGEIANVQNAAGVPTQIVSWYNSILQGDSLGPKQRDEIARIVGGAYTSANELYKQEAQKYTTLATNYLVRPENVVTGGLFYTPEQLSGARDTGRQKEGRKPPTIKPGDVVDGYRFKGGDPGNQLNWEPAQ